MKQNSQWLSHVRTRSKTAEDTSVPSGSPASLRTGMAKGPRPAAADDEVQLGFVHQRGCTR